MSLKIEQGTTGTSEVLSEHQKRAILNALKNNQSLSKAYLVSSQNSSQSQSLTATANYWWPLIVPAFNEFSKTYSLFATKFGKLFWWLVFLSSLRSFLVNVYLLINALL